MKKATLQPTAEDSYRIVYDPADKGPTYEQAIRKALAQEADGDIEGACNTRYRAFRQIAGLIPEDEAVTLDWEDPVSQSALVLINFSAIDHFLLGDYEMCAAMLEMLLDLDPEDHLEAVKRLACCYVALDEYELFDEVVDDISDKHPEKELLKLWSGFRRTGVIPQGELVHFRKAFPACYAEFTAAEHPVTPEYLAGIDSERPSRENLARQLWLETEHLWAQFPGFIETLRSGAGTATT